MSKLPDHVIADYGSAREFKRRKRDALRNVIAAADELIFGCIYSPAYDEIVKLRELLKIAKEKQSVKNWGR